MEKIMYYNRELWPIIVSLLKEEYRWLVDYVKEKKDLDFQTGSNKDQSWVSVYRGTSRLFRIISCGKGKRFNLDANKKYMNLEPDLYKKPSKALFESLIEKIKTHECIEGPNKGKKTFDRYFDNKKEGYHQNNISRRYGICGRKDDEIIIVDKEAVIGFINDNVRKAKLNSFSQPYRELAREIMELDGSCFPSKLDEISLGNECDFIVLTKEGELILMELKDFRDTQKIYLSPFQISMYCDIFNHFDAESEGEFRKTILKMIKQKQELGLLNSAWSIPQEITKISAALVVGFDLEENIGKLSKTAIKNYKIVRNYVKKYHIDVYYSVGESGELAKNGTWK